VINETESNNGMDQETKDQLKAKAEQMKQELAKEIAEEVSGDLKMARLKNRNNITNMMMLALLVIFLFVVMKKN
jgi:hypothetical protein